MVTKITLFEPHFDGAQFGPASIPGGDPGDENDSADREDANQSESRSGGRPIKLAGLAILVALIAGIVARRFRSESKPERGEIDDQSTDRSRSVTG